MKGNEVKITEARYLELIANEQKVIELIEFHIKQLLVCAKRENPELTWNELSEVVVGRLQESGFPYPVAIDHLITYVIVCYVYFSNQSMVRYHDGKFIKI